MKIHKKIILSILIFTVLLVLTLSLVIEAAGKLSEDSSIANVLVEGLTAEEAKVRLQEEIAIWYSGEDLIGESNYESITIPRNIFEFDIDTSIQNLEERTKRHWSTFFMKKKNVHVPLVVNINDSIDIPDHIDAEQLFSDASQIASNLGEDSISITYNEGATMDMVEIAKVEFSIPNVLQATINHIVEQLDGYTVPVDSAFSFMETITLLDSFDDSNDETSFIASAIYVAALQTNLEIMERHSQGTVPSYTEAGMEAEVNYKEEKDLLLYNPNPYPITFDVVVENDELILTLESTSNDIISELSVENKVDVEPKTITRYSSDLSFGETETIQSGKKGLQVEVYRTLDGEVEKEIVARDYYAPKPTIVVVSSKQEPELDESEITEMVENELTERFTPERLISNNVLEQGSSLNSGSDSNDSDDSEETNNEFSTMELFYSCMLESLRDGIETSDEESSEEESTEENEEVEESLGYCDLFVLSMLGELMQGEGSLLEELENNEGETSLREELENTEMK